MINLIPPAAKKQIVREYWFRVASVWLFLLGSALLLVVLMMVPAFVLVNSQLTAFDISNTVPVEDMQTFQTIKSDVESANAAARLLTSNEIELYSYELVNTLDSLTSSKVEFVGFSTLRDRSEFARISLQGVAADRESLVTFQEAVINHELFETADLPLSNFAERSDISFTMNITLAEQ